MAKFYFTQVWGLFLRETSRFFRVPLQTIGSPLMMSTLLFLIFGVSLGNSISLPNGLPYLAFLIPGIMGMNMIQSSYENASSSVIGAKYVNELQELRFLPFSLFQIILAKALSSLVRGTIVLSLTYLSGITLFYLQHGQFLTIAHPLLLLLFILLGSLTFGMFGISVGMRAKSFEHTFGITTFFLTPLTYLGGVFFSLQSLHPIWQKITQFNPLFYLVNGFRFACLGQSDVSPVMAFSILVASMFCFYLVAHASLKKGESYVR